MIKENKISASLMCADPFNLMPTITTIEKHNIDYLHIDIMDGKFVPNLGLGCDFINALRKHTNIPMDFHLMVKEPDSIIDLLDIREQDIVSVHYESSYQIQRTLENIRKKRCKIMIALNPATSVCFLEELIHYIDGVNLLMVNPGFAGQKMTDNALKKAEKMAQFIKEHSIEDFIFEVDGNISFEAAKTLKSIGANMFVCGSSCMFNSGGLEHNIKQIQSILL